MINAVVLIIVILVMILALKSSLKHFRGEGACCGGGGGISSKEKPPVKKLSGEKLGEKVVSISGMHCDHCVGSVTKAINQIEGASAKVSLRRGEALVAYDRTLSDEKLKAAVEAQGFQVTEIRG